MRDCMNCEHRKYHEDSWGELYFGGCEINEDIYESNQAETCLEFNII